MDEVSDAHDRDEKCILSFVWETWR